MTATERIPRLYPILDAGLLAARNLSLREFARELRAGGVRFLQYRDKEGGDEAALHTARMLREIFPAGEATLLINDRAHLCRPAGFDGVHLGQGDLPVEQARAMLGPHAVIGLSTHNPEQLRDADRLAVDYLAIGPVYATMSKSNPDPVVGLEGVARARRLTGKSLVAIGGITRANGRAVLEAGADAVAVISALLPREGESAAEVLRDFLAVFR